MIRAIIFDCFGVLYQGSLHHLIATCPPENRQQLKEYSRQFDRGMIDYKAFLELVAELSAKPADQIRRIMSTAHIRNQPLIDYTKQLRRGGYQVGLLSNIGRGVMASLFDDTEQSQLFDIAVLSGEVGLVKPDPLIFEYTARQLGVQTDECLMIDDSVDNINGARRVQMQGIVYSDVEQLIKDVDAIITT